MKINTTFALARSGAAGGGGERRQMATCIVPNGAQYAVNAVIDERERQDAKWGPQDHPLPVWLAILMEEVGELSECVLHAQFGGHAAEHLRKEAVQVAAVALALIQAIDEGRAWTLPLDLRALKLAALAQPEAAAE